MPVLISAPPSEMDIVRPLALNLLEGGGEVRCYLEEDDHELRQEGCKIAVGNLRDELTLEGALTNVHTAIPIFPDPATIFGSDDLSFMREVGFALVDALDAARVEQTILPLTGLYRTPTELGGTFDQIRRLFEERIHPLCIVVTGLLWGEERAFPVDAGLLGDRSHSLSVLAIADLVAALTAADDREDLNGMWELGGATLNAETLVSISGERNSVAPSALFREAATAVTQGLSNSAADEFGVDLRLP